MIDLGRFGCNDVRASRLYRTLSARLLNAPHPGSERCRECAVAAAKSDMGTQDMTPIVLEEFLE